MTMEIEGIQLVRSVTHEGLAIFCSVIIAVAVLGTLYYKNIKNTLFPPRNSLLDNIAKIFNIKSSDIP